MERFIVEILNYPVSGGTVQYRINSGAAQTATVVADSFEIEAPDGSTAQIRISKDGKFSLWSDTKSLDVPVFDFSTIDGLRLCLLPGQGLTTDGDGGVDIWNSQFVNSYAEAPQASQRPAVQTNSESGLLVPHFDGLDDRLLFKEANGTNLTAGLTTSFMLLKSDGLKTYDNQGMIVFSNNNNDGFSYISLKGSDISDISRDFGSPSLRVDEADVNPTTRGDVWNLIYGVNAVKLTTISDGDMSVWTAPQIGAFRNETGGFYMYQGEILAKLIYDGTLTPQQIETVESELLKLI